MTTAAKDTIYIDVDDEITAIIDKIQSSDSNIVALVLPKRATALQSIVNMKLLKRSGADAGKNIVLITSEASLLPLAGAIGMYTAKTLQTKPEIPAGPKIADAQEDVAELDDDLPPEAAAKPVGVLAGSLAEDTVDMNDAEEPKPSTKSDNAPKKKQGPKAKVPDFDKFRTKLLVGLAALLVFIGGWYVMAVMMPSSKIVITTDTEDLNASLTFTANPSATSVSVDDNIVPAVKVETSKEDSAKIAASGEKDVGEKASGSVTFSARMCNTLSQPGTLAAGSAVTSQSRKFTTDTAVTFAFSGTIDGSCVIYNGTSSEVTAENSGTNSNLESATFAVTGRSEVSGSGSTSGGTSKIVKVVSQQDVDDAKAKLDTGEDAISGELESQLQQQGLLAITETLSKSDEKTDISPAVGSEATEVTVSYSATFSMLGVKNDDLTQVVNQAVQKEIDPDRQQVQNAGLEQASYKPKKPASDGKTTISMSTIAAIGPKIDTEKLKSEIAGKKKGETEQIVRAFPGVNDVTISFSPFWVNKTPKNPSKVIIEFTQIGQ